MPYIKSTCDCGLVREVRKYHTHRYNSPKRPRNKNHNKTTETQKKVNQRHSERKLTRLINANFKDGDLHITLTYDNDIDLSAETARKELNNFIRRLKYQYSKQGFELKYITVTEYENKRIHHHIVINNIPDIISNMYKFWKNGIFRCSVLNTHGNYSELANYLIKETSKTYNTPDRIYGKRWNRSKNLIFPKEKKTVVKSSTWSELVPKEADGYYLITDSIYSGFDESGYPCLFYMMLKPYKSCVRRE